MRTNGEPTPRRKIEAGPVLKSTELKEIREALHLDQRGFGDVLDVSQRYINLMEQGKRTMSPLVSDRARVAMRAPTCSMSRYQGLREKAARGTKVNGGAKSHLLACFLLGGRRVAADIPAAALLPIWTGRMLATDGCFERRDATGWSISTRRVKGFARQVTQACRSFRQEPVAGVGRREISRSASVETLAAKFTRATAMEGRENMTRPHYSGERTEGSKSSLQKPWSC